MVTFCCADYLGGHAARPVAGVVRLAQLLHLVLPALGHSVVLLVLAARQVHACARSRSTGSVSLPGLAALLLLPPSAATHCHVHGGHIIAAQRWFEPCRKPSEEWHRGDNGTAGGTSKTSQY